MKHALSGQNLGDSTKLKKVDQLGKGINIHAGQVVWLTIPDRRFLAGEWRWGWRRVRLHLDCRRSAREELDAVRWRGRQPRVVGGAVRDEDVLAELQWRVARHVEQRRRALAWQREGRGAGPDGADNVARG